jgi:hypothetical protein
LMLIVDIYGRRVPINMVAEKEQISSVLQRKVTSSPYYVHRGHAHPLPSPEEDVRIIGSVGDDVLLLMIKPLTSNIVC